MYDLGLIAEQLRNARLALGLSQTAAAEMCSVSLRTLRDYENKGIRDLLTLDKICKCYGISITIIVG
jgi:transcriptional regulator with XRE-family HTH domain